MSLWENSLGVQLQPLKTEGSLGQVTCTYLLYSSSVYIFLNLHIYIYICILIIMFIFNNIKQSFGNKMQTSVSSVIQSFFATCLKFHQQTKKKARVPNLEGNPLHMLWCLASQPAMVWGHLCCAQYSHRPTEYGSDYTWLYPGRRAVPIVMVSFTDSRLARTK